MDIKFDTLKYLVNNDYNLIDNTVEDKNNLVNKNDKKFYKKRLLAVTKQLFKEDNYNKASKSTQLVFDIYIDKMIEMFKNVDMDEVRKDEYKTIKEEGSEFLSDDETLVLLNYDIENIINEPKQIKIEDYLNIKKNKKKYKPILPETKNYDLKTEKNKKKRNI